MLSISTINKTTFLQWRSFDGVLHKGISKTSNRTVPRNHRALLAVVCCGPTTQPLPWSQTCMSCHLCHSGPYSGWLSKVNLILRKCISHIIGPFPKAVLKLWHDKEWLGQLAKCPFLGPVPIFRDLDSTGLCGVQETRFLTNVIKLFVVKGHGEGGV